MKGHGQIFYIEMVLMAIGIVLMVTGDFSTGLILFAFGALIHFGMGGFATGF